MADDEQFGWVFDSLVGFLKGPVWDAAVLTFIEQKSVVFEPEGGNEEEYKKIHEEYRNLVDVMLGSHMEDLGITPDQFEQACGETDKHIHSQFRKSLFEQIWAADDYEIFIRMMTQKNIELQLQAIDLMAYQYGLSPSKLLPEQDYEPSKGEKSIMEEVKKRYVAESKQKVGEVEDKNTIEATKAHLVAERQKEKELLEKAIEHSLQEKLPEIPIIKKEQVREPPSKSIAIAQVSPEEARQRQEYLRKQRDRLLSLKKQERQKQLNQYEQTSQRPRSARAAKRIVEEDDENEKASVDPKILAFRKSLAARLKAEVVGDKED